MFRRHDCEIPEFGSPRLQIERGDGLAQTGAATGADERNHIVASSEAMVVAPYGDPPVSFALLRSVVSTARKQRYNILQVLTATPEQLMQSLAV